MGVALSDAHSAIHSGPLRRSTPNASAATISGWTLPRDAMSTMKLPMRTANAVAALLRILRAGTTTATDAPISAIDHGRVDVRGRRVQRLAVTKPQRGVPVRADVRDLPRGRAPDDVSDAVPDADRERQDAGERHPAARHHGCSPQSAR